MKDSASLSPDKLVARVRKAQSEGDRVELLEHIFETSTEAKADDEAASQLRNAFLLLVRNAPELLEREDVSNFLAHEVQPPDFDKLQWETPEHMLEFCEMLYGFRFPTETLTERVRGHVRLLLRQALQHYEEDKNWESLFLLLRVAPTTPVMQDVELMRLRHLARAYEIRRIQRNRRWLYTYLIVQAALVLVVFPFLFIYAENGAIQRQVEQLANIELGDEGYRLFSYMDGLYWSVITAGSIGYGDVTPMTATGRIIAGILGTMGVVTAGVIAGLVLKWITPRTLD